MVNGEGEGYSHGGASAQRVALERERREYAAAGDLHRCGACVLAHRLRHLRQRLRHQRDRLAPPRELAAPPRAAQLHLVGVRVRVRVRVGVGVRVRVGVRVGVRVRVRVRVSTGSGAVIRAFSVARRYHHPCASIAEQPMTPRRCVNSTAGSAPGER